MALIEENQMLMSPSHYHEDDEPGARLPPIQHKSSHFTSRRTSIWSRLSLCLAVFALTSLFWGILLLRLRRSCHSQVEKTLYSQPKATEPGPNFKTHARYISCGKSISESKSLGCKYDVLSNHWVPWQCMDDGSVETYQSDGSWFGFTDENRTQLIGSAEAMGSAGVYYTNMRDHIVHCAALWKKQFNAFFEERVYYDSLILDPKHTYHCADFLVDMTDKGRDFRTIPIKVEVGHAGCWVRERVATIERFVSVYHSAAMPTVLRSCTTHKVSSLS